MNIDILEVLSVFSPLIILVIEGIALVIKAIKIKSTKNAVNLFEDNGTEDRPIEKPPKKFYISHNVIILIVLFFILKYSSLNIVGAVVWGIINIIPILLYVHMAKLIEQRKGQDISNMALFDNDLSKEDKK